MSLAKEGMWQTMVPTCVLGPAGCCNSSLIQQSGQFPGFSTGANQFTKGNRPGERCPRPQLLDGTAELVI